MTIFVFGCDGMLGSYFIKYYQNSDIECIGFTRKNLDIATAEKKNIFELFTASNAKKQDVVINCAGVLKDKSIDKKTYVKVNIDFPIILSEICTSLELILIHISTDCVFSGDKGACYDERDTPDPVDLYGMSKFIGEPAECMVIRTSIIGSSKKNRNLLASLQKLNDKQRMLMKGYKNCLWNGLTCLQLVKFIDNCIRRNMIWTGIHHVHSPDFLSKFELLNILNDVYNLDLMITPSDTPIIDRRLSSIYNKYDHLPKIREQIMQQHSYDNTFKNLDTD